MPRAPPALRLFLPDAGRPAVIERKIKGHTMTPAEFRYFQENIEGLGATLAVVAVVAFGWLLLLTIFADDGHGEKIKGLQRRVEDGDDTTTELIKRIYAVENRVADDPPRHTVKSALEEGIDEMASVEKWRATLVEEHGELSPEMEDLFGEYRKAVRDRRMAQFTAEVETLMGTGGKR